MDGRILLYGERLLPRILDDYAEVEPEKLYTSIPRLATDLSRGFLDITAKDMAHCVDVLAHQLEGFFGRSSNFETICYLGPPDLRGAMIFLAAVKCGYKILLLSLRLPPATVVGLLDQTVCSKMLYAEELASFVKSLQQTREKIQTSQIPPIDDILNAQSHHYPYNKQFSEAQNDPIVILHSSGSTGTPKPIVMTHGTFSILDRERLLPQIPHRQNIDFSIWDFQQHPVDSVNKFYTPFPFFHLSGFLSTVVNPLFTNSVPVLGPALAPPSSSILKAVLLQQQPHCRAVYIPPALAEALLHDPAALNLFGNLDFIAYTGGPFSPAAGAILSAITTLRPFYGSTEAFQVPQLAPLDPRSDYAYMEWHPSFKVEMQPVDIGEEAGAVYELVLFNDDTTQKMSALNHNFPSTQGEWRTKDLFLRHPSPGKGALWKYYGRRDDIVVLSTGAKFNPVPMELRLAGHPKVAGALVVGKGRPKAGLLVEMKVSLESLKDPYENQEEKLPDQIWDAVQAANAECVREEAMVEKALVMLADAAKPFARAGKGTVVRGMTERAYEDEIERMYFRAPGA